MCGRRDGSSRPHPDRPARHAALAKKVSRAKHGDDCFFSGAIHHGEFHAALLDVPDAFRSLSLRVNRFAPSKFYNLSRHSCGIEEDLRVKRSGSSVLLYCFCFHIQVEVPPLTLAWLLRARSYLNKKAPPGTVQKRTLGSF